VKNWKIMLSKSIGIIGVLILIFFFGHYIKSFYSNYPSIALLAPFSIVGLSVYFTLKERKEKNKTGESDARNIRSDN